MGPGAETAGVRWEMVTHVGPEQRGNYIEGQGNGFINVGEITQNMERGRLKRTLAEGLELDVWVRTHGLWIERKREDLGLLGETADSRVGQRTHKMSL